MTMASRLGHVGELAIVRGDVTLSGEEAGEGIPVVLLHGLTATRRYVVMGSRALERSGHRAIAYDARGHGRSSPARAYGYPELAGDLAALLDALEIERAVLTGASMGAHTALRFALDEPARAAALVLITPAHDPATADDPERLARWDALSAGLRSGGVDGFVAAYGDAPDPVVRVLRQRLAEHEHLDAVADALREVPRSAPFAAWEDLRALDAPAVVVASRDELDPGHPYAVAEAYARALPDARLIGEEPGHSPLAWQGGRVSRVIAEAASAAARAGRVP
jgi:pimeloyl-ACP methyl ester carboxylesterase